MVTLGAHSISVMSLLEKARDKDREGIKSSALFVGFSFTGGHDNIFVFNNGLIKVVLKWPCIEI